MIFAKKDLIFRIIFINYEALLCFALCYATIAQLVERLICNQLVAGSTPAGGLEGGEVPEWPKGTDCKSVGAAFGGSNPPLPTQFQAQMWYRSGTSFLNL